MWPIVTIIFAQGDLPVNQPAPRPSGPAFDGIRSSVSTILSEPTKPQRHVGTSVIVGHSRPSRWTRWLLLTIVAASLLPLIGQTPLALAASITVTTTTDEDNGSLGGGTGVSLREAVLYASTNDVINLPAGTYTLTIPGGGNNDGKKGDLDVISKAITIAGAGATSTKIVASFPNTESNTRDRVIDVLPGAALTLSGVTISGGSASTPGGGIRNQGTLSATAIVVSGNFSAVFAGNRVSGDSGGGIANAAGTATIVNSTIKGNTAKVSGGGLFNATGATMTLYATTVANNVTTEQNGGGIANEGALNVANSTLSGNSANRSGGGIYNNGTATVTNATITGNICNADTRIAGNGGGAFNNSPGVGSLTFKNSIIAGNIDRLNPPSATTPQSYFPDLNAQTSNTIVGNSNNLIGSRAGINNSTTIGTPGQSDIVNVDAGLAVLTDNGSGTPIHLLQSSSPAIDSANDTTCTSAPISNRDQRGSLRPADGNADANAVCDIGAVEVRAAIVLLDDTLAIASGGSLNFGSTPRDTPLTKVLTIRNDGEATLVLDEAPLSVPTGFTLVEGIASTRIQPGEETTLTLQFNATILGATSGQLTFGTNDPAANPFQLTLTGTATAKPATLVVSANSSNLPSGALFSFGSTASGTPVDQTFTVTNSGDENLTLGAITPPTGFVIQNQPGATTLTPNAATTFTVRLSASAPGVPAGTLSIASNAGSDNPFLLRLKGIVSGSATDQLFVLDNTNVSEVTNGSSVTFGTTVVGTPLLRTFTLANIGNGPLTVNAPLTLPAGFSLVGSFSTTILGVGQSVDVQIKADATNTGAPSGTASFGNSDTDENPFSFTVNATVNTSPAKVVVTEGTATIADNTGRSNFGSTVIGTPVVKTFTISNTGGSDLVLTSATVPAGFEIISPFTSPVAPGASTSVQVRLRATAVGTFSGVLSFGTTDPTANPFNFTVSGTVTNPPAQIVVTVGTTTVTNGSSVDLGVTPLGVPVSKLFTITNNGGSILTINSINVPSGFTRDPDVATADTLAPGASTAFVVVLDSDTAGTFDGRVTILTNDPVAADFGFTIIGTVGQRNVYLPLMMR